MKRRTLSIAAAAAALSFSLACNPSPQPVLAASAGAPAPCDAALAAAPETSEHDRTIARLQQEARNSPGVQRIKVALQQANRNLKRLSDAGITIGMGTDTASPNDLGRWPGYFEHTEMEMMTQAGMTPMQVMVSATSGAARILRIDNVGTIATGKEADLVVLNANPLDNIRNTRQINSVWIAGRRIPASR